MPSRFWVNLSIAALLAAPAVALAQSGRTDAQIKADVESKLHSDADLQGIAIGVNVVNGVVTLTGNAASDDQLTKAENDISSIQGITQIQDNLQVAGAPAQYNTDNNAQNEAAAAAQNAQPPAGADQQGGDMDQPQPGYGNQGYGNQPPPPNNNGYGAENGGAENGYNNPPPPPPNGYGNNGPGYGPPNGNPPNGYGNNYGNYNRPPRPVHYAPGGTQVTLPQNTVITVRTLENVVAGKTPNGAFVRGVVARDIPGPDGVVLPRGTAVTLQVMESKGAGAWKGAAVLKLKISNLTLGNQTYVPISDTWDMNSAGKGGQTAGSAVGGAAFGALLGAIAGGGPGAAIGAGAGAVAGGTLSGTTGRPQAYVPAEGLVTFRIQTPLTVTTVPPDVAKTLAAAAPPLQQTSRPGARVGPPPSPYYRPYAYGPYYGPY